MGHRVRPQPFPQFFVTALGHQIFVGFAQHRREAVGIVLVPDMRAGMAAQRIGKGVPVPGKLRHENAFGVKALHLGDGLALGIQHLDLARIGGEL